ncbi:Sodium-driven chloride bicarbonate exchanger [Halotydeus destructor]|nr:Sodium-driven chloride bicarbonate exchanger [Halotydeus destructor]
MGSIRYSSLKPWMEPETVASDEASKDPGVQGSQHGQTDLDLEGHRAHSMYVGFHVPGSGYRRRGHHRRHHRHHHHKNGHKKDGNGQDDRPVTPPSERVHFILGEDDTDGLHESHPLFSELEELVSTGDGDVEWKETARWIKFEEDVEEGGDRWSKPHVATISLHSLFELRSCILNGTVMLDLEATSLDQIADLVLENMVNAGQLNLDLRDRVKEALLRRHRHQHEKHKNKGSGLSNIRSLVDIGRNSSRSVFGSHSSNEPSSNMPQSPSSSSLSHLSAPNAGPQQPGNNSGSSIGDASSSNDLQHKANQAFMRKIPAGAEADNILVGELDFLERPISAFVRLSQACHLGDLTEVPVPTRFLFLLLGPHTIPGRYHEIGRSMATLMSDEVFHEIAYKAKSRNDLLAGVDEFLDAVTILPPGAWDPSIRIEPPGSVPSQQSRKKAENHEDEKEVDLEEEEEREREQNGLTFTGKWFGGLRNDISRKAPWYWSDFKDAFALQSIASVFFLYFACLAPIITFGGLLGEATGQNIATMESLLTGALCGIVYGFFSGQPLTILGSTGPVLVFETILYDFCTNYGFHYLSVRLWIGIWTSGILMALVAFDASALVCYITRFTEENFATLISVIFIYKAVEKVLNIKTTSRMRFDYDKPLNYSCSCFYNDDQAVLQTYFRNESSLESCTSKGGELTGPGCDLPNYVPDVFLFSVILFLATYTISLILKDFKMASYFPATVRALISDFAVVIAILSMTFMDILVGLDTPKLMVPREFKPTSPHRDWLFPWFHPNNPWWICIITVIPALLATILIFMDQQITAVIINRKENKLKKGCGYHLDLFILGGLILTCSILGLPWFVAATVLSMTHVNSLRMESECAAPGDKPQFLGVREQRVTHITIFVLCGLSVFITGILSRIPMPVLFGVFLYMGTSSLKGSQMFDRILIVFMPAKYQPDYMFLRQVPIHRVHLFTIIQLACFSLLWIIKSYKPTSIAFPLMLVFMIGVRKMLDFVFTQAELKILDDVMPDHAKKEKHEGDDDVSDGHVAGLLPNASSGNVAIPLANGTVLKIPVEKFNSSADQTSINISEQLAKSSAWKTIDQQAHHSQAEKSNTSSKKKRATKKDAKTEEEQKRLSVMAEDEEDGDDCGITIRVDCPTPLPSSHPSNQNSPQDERSGPKSETPV